MYPTADATYAAYLHTYMPTTVCTSSAYMIALVAAEVECGKVANFFRSH